MTKKIPLTQGKFAIVDDDDYDFLMQWKWYFSKGGYAVRTKQRKMFLMHREIMNTPQGMDTDHINRDRLDNRRSNLRICNRCENQHNRIGWKKILTSKYKGVCFVTRDKKWVAQIWVNSKKFFLGYFDSEIEAAKAYDCAAKRLHGKFTRLNLIQESAI